MTLARIGCTWNKRNAHEKITGPYVNLDVTPDRESGGPALPVSRIDAEFDFAVKPVIPSTKVFKPNLRE
jgi:hypothetical protein